MDLSLLSPDARARVEALAAELVNKELERAALASWLEVGDWAAIEHFARKAHGNPPEQFVPRKTYNTLEVSFYQHTSFGFQSDFHHPFWPVVMRGSRWSMIRKRGHSTLNFSDDIFSRWLRMKKVTALGYSEFWQQCDDFETKLRLRYGSRQRRDKCYQHFDYGLCSREGERRVYIAGQEQILSRWQYQHMKALRAIIDKTDKLDQRINLVRAWRQEALAA